MDGFLYSARRPNAAYAAVPFVTGDLRFDLAPYLQRARLPVAAFWGAEESQVGQAVRKRMQDLRPDIRFDLIPQAKTCPELERPEAVAGLIREALAYGLAAIP